MRKMAKKPRITILAGVNGSGKSSVGGATFRKKGDYYNPDEAARKLIEANPGISQIDANIVAWQNGKDFLEQAIKTRKDYVFETTLGGETITDLLEQAISAGIEVWVWYVGLSSPDLCIARVNARVAAGGHSIPEAKIRERYIKSPLNLIRLLPNLTKLVVFDNSKEGDPRNGKCPQPQLILNMEHGCIINVCNLPNAPEWAKPILVVALNLMRQKPAA